MHQFVDARMLEVVVADDHPVVRRGLARLLDSQQDIAVVGQAAGGEEALALSRALEPDLLLLDVSMEDMDGLAVLAALAALPGEPRPRVLLVSMHEDPGLVARALAAGAAGYVSKQSASSEVLAAVRAVGAGETYLCKRARALLRSS